MKNLVFEMRASGEVAEANERPVQTSAETIDRTPNPVEKLYQSENFEPGVLLVAALAGFYALAKTIRDYDRH